MLSRRNLVVNFIFVIFILISSGSIAYTQVSSSGKPVSFSVRSLKNIPVVTLPAFNVDSLVKREFSGTSSQLKVDRFAKTFDLILDYKNCGLWTIRPDGMRIWQLGIRSKGAYSLNILFSKYKLNAGAKLFLYNASHDYVLGAFTAANNKSFGMLAVSPVPGDLIYIELQVPVYVKDPGELVIGKVGHDYLDFFHNKKLKDTWYGTSGSCNLDINCYADTMIQKIKYSVVRIVYDGQERCTGTLINNTNLDGKPYLLTAQHCLSSEYLANTATFYFNYESPYCDGPDGNALRSISGSTIKATTDTSFDFTLVQLSEYPPLDYKPYFAGWNRKDLAPAHSYCIHHPWGDVKKIAVDNDSAVSASFTGYKYDINAHWKILRWDIGVTEPGSSGGPLFDQDYRLVGDLTGGEATCASPRNDYFQKFARIWADYPNPSNQLKYWLDPSNTGVEFINGYDPYISVFEQADTLFNIGADENLILPAAPSWGYLSGQNSYGTGVFAEKFNSNRSRYLYGVIMDVAKAFPASDTSSIILNVWNDTLSASNLVYQQEIKINNFLEDTLNFIQMNQIVQVNNIFYVGYQVQYHQPSDTFALYMADGRVTGGLNTAYIYENNQWKMFENATAGGYISSFDIKTIAFDSVPTAISSPTYKKSDDIAIFPNPVRDYFTIKTQENFGKSLTVHIIDLNGKILTKKRIVSPPNELNIPVENLQEGIYLIRLLYRDQVITKKIAIVK